MFQRVEGGSEIVWLWNSERDMVTVSLLTLFLLNSDVSEQFHGVKTVGGRGLTHGACEWIDISFLAGREDERMDDNDEAGRGDGKVNNSCTEVVHQIYVLIFKSLVLELMSGIVPLMVRHLGSERFSKLTTVSRRELIFPVMGHSGYVLWQCLLKDMRDKYSLARTSLVFFDYFFNCAGKRYVLFHVHCLAVSR